MSKDSGALDWVVEDRDGRLLLFVSEAGKGNSWIEERERRKDRKE
jgi:hypothetical protein